jgi:uncharacterized protein YbbC (DUF1343 family)
MDAYAAAVALNARAGSWKLEAGSWKLEAGGRSGAGVVFRPTSFEPTSSKYAGETCYGVQMHVTDRDALSPARLGVLIVATLKALYPRQFAWRDYPRADGSRLFTIDRLTGSDATRKLLEAGAPAAEVVAGWAAVEEEFRRRREACLLYE